MANILATVPAACLAVLAYTWVGYPFLLALCARLLARSREAPSPAPDGALPRLHVLISAYNEADVIEARLANILSLDYPSDRIAVHVGADGCTDDTAAIVRAFSHSHPSLNLTLHEHPTNRGKPAVLKDLVTAVALSAARNATPDTRHATPDTRHLLLFTDANTHFRSDALRLLVRHFSDSSVGGVCGRLILRQPSLARSPSQTVPESKIENQKSKNQNHPEGFYWSLETHLKRWESSLDSCLGANGAIYAIRPELFWDGLPPNTVVDDFVIGMKVREQGFRMRYEPEAVAEEELPAQRDEWARRVRIGSGDYQAAALCRRCLSPRFGWFAWSFWSHKLLRWFTPHLMVLAAATAAAGSLGAPVLRQSAPLPIAVSLAVLFLCGLWAFARLVARDLRARADMAGARTASARARRSRADMAGARTASARARRSRATLPFSGEGDGTSLPSLSQCSSLRSAVCGVRSAVLRPLSHLDHFLTMQAALLAGFFRYCRGDLAGAWRRTPRPGHVQALRQGRPSREGGPANDERPKPE